MKFFTFPNQKKKLSFRFSYDRKNLLKGFFSNALFIFALEISSSKECFIFLGTLHHQFYIPHMMNQTSQCSDYFYPAEPTKLCQLCTLIYLHLYRKLSNPLLLSVYYVDYECPPWNTFLSLMCNAELWPIKVELYWIKKNWK